MRQYGTVTSWGDDSLLTPDYCHCPWTAAASARLTEHGTVEVRWPDGTAPAVMFGPEGRAAQFRPGWLRHAPAGDRDTAHA